MKTRAARTAGFCFGVRKALDLVLDALREDRARHGGSSGLCTLGPLIHNDQALEALEARGVRAVGDLDAVKDGRVVIRAHGAGPTVRDEILRRNLRIIDATCPRVVRCQKAVERAASAGRQILIAGDEDHAEVAALLDFARRRGKGEAGPPVVVDTVERAGALELRAPVTLVAQTTFNSKTYGEIASVLKRRLADGGEPGGGALEVVRSVCHSAEERQRETEELAGEVDAVVVVGGRHSANTRRLAEVAARGGRPVFHVETADDLRALDFRGLSVVGVTAGASTPAWITESVAERLLDIGSPTGRLFRRLAKVLLGSNLLLAAGAASLTYAAMGLVGSALNPLMLFLAFAYVLFAYATNRATEEASSTVAGSAHAEFFNRYKRTILAAAWILAASAIALAFRAGPTVGIVFAAAVLFAAVYSIRIFPERMMARGVARLRDIPGSKDFFVAVGLAFVAVVLPHLAAPLAGHSWQEPLVAGGGVFLLGFCAATALELGDIQSDRLIGRESVAVLLGYPRARALVAGGALVVAAAMAVPSLLGWMRPAAWGLAAAGAGVVCATARKRTPGDALAVEVAIQLALLVSGPVAYLAESIAAGP